MPARFKAEGKKLVRYIQGEGLFDSLRDWARSSPLVISDLVAEGRARLELSPG